ncbi:GNAT family N-acetyltransferase [Solitalea lacus]|uniref:GNAT family N-acetyltransferase n=1 Tax=Solitalea lacus TaxID=2911172 RepID=UPI001EDB4421|nr:GNAT family N-acetyltransferase [Solitalea lacus]UKJ09115.1 GNAT family N-acetyltransferase [Solitalea lacus]
MKELTFQELSIHNWSHFENLMGQKGGCAGCWCMWYRLSSKEFNENKYEGNKLKMHSLVNAGKFIGLMAFVENVPVAWIALAPREDYYRIEKSKSLARLDDKPVWSITCFFVKKDYRRLGISKKLIHGAIVFAKSKGIKTLEAYPSIPYAVKSADAFLWGGILTAFLANSFQIAKYNGKSKAIVRLDV